MATNTLGTTNANVIAQKALAALIQRFPFLRKIATDFSSEGGKFNETIIVHEVTAAEAVEFDPAVGYAPADRSMVDIPVKIDHHAHHTYKVGVDEASSSRVNLIERLSMTAAASLGAKIMSEIMKLITAANFPTATIKALGAGGDGFDRKAAVAVGTALDGRNVEDFDRYMLLNALYYGSLCSDTPMMQVLLASGADAVKTGALPEIQGLAPLKYSAMPAGAQNLVGFAGGRTALALATRLPDDPGQGMGNCKISTVTDEDSGLSIQVREWYNADLGQYRRSYVLMFGVAVGQKDAGQRILSAAPAA